MNRPIIYLIFAISVIVSINCVKVKKRQIPGNSARLPAEELLPPPALSASFPTLRPRTPNLNTPRSEQPPRDLVPPPFKPQDVAPPIPTSSSSLPNNFQSTNPELPLLPPLEIPPEKPLSDAEIQQTIQGVRDTSFIPTTGQGATAQVNKNAEISLSLPPPSTGIPIPNTNGNNVTTSNNVRFPDSQPLSNFILKNCPTCECTSEVDYICASNGVLYLNSCSFDCATFCDSGLRKVPLELCSSQNTTK